MAATTEAEVSANETTSDPTVTSHEGLVPRGLVGQRLGRYEILCELATGGMASVYVARAQGLAGFERLVAIKVLHPHLAHDQEFISMFLDEARLAARIRHPNVVATQDIDDSSGDGFFLVMDYVAGDHLGNLLAQLAPQRRALAPMIVARIVTDVLSGLAAAHDLVDENGAPLHIVHRDLSPHNILVGVEGVARLTDFGVAKAEARLASTRTGQFKGKLSYVAPEQASNGACDHRSDLFAMGTVLWEALTARRLFRGDTTVATITKLMTARIPLPSEIRPELEPWDRVLARALKRDPALRFQSAYEFVEAIDEVARREGGLASARALATAVRELVGDKIDDEQRRVKDAIVLSNGPDYVSQTNIPIPSSPTSGSIALSASHARVAARESVAPPSGEHPTYTVVVREVSGRISAVLMLALIVVAVAAGVAGYYLHRAETPPPQRLVVRPPTPSSVTHAPGPERAERASGAQLATPAPDTNTPNPNPNTKPEAASVRSTSPSDGRRVGRRSRAPVIVEENPYHTY